MIQVGDTIYQLQYRLTFGEITGISSTAYNVESIDEEREKAIVVEPRGLKLTVSLFHVENQTLLWREQQVPTDDITERYMWTTDTESGMKKMVEESIQVCNDTIKQFSELNQQLFNLYKNNPHTVQLTNKNAKQDIGYFTTYGIFFM